MFVQLCHGEGNGQTKACLLTANNMLIGKGKDLDRNSCVCWLLRKFIPFTNDLIPEEHLGRLYGPLVCEITGTVTNNPLILTQRANHFVNWCVSAVMIPFIEQANQDYASKLKALPIIDSQATAARCYTKLSHLTSVFQPDFPKLSYSRQQAVRQLYYSCECLSKINSPERMALYPDSVVGEAEEVLDHVVAMIRFAVFYNDKQTPFAMEVWEKCPGLIRDICAIGKRCDVTYVMSEAELAAALAPLPLTV